MAKKAGSVHVEIFADDRRFMVGLRRVKANLRAFGRSVGTIGKKMQRMAATGSAAMKRLGTSIRSAGQSLKGFGASAQGAGRALGGLALAGAAPIALATKIFASFDDQMRVVQAKSGADPLGFEKLTEEAKRLGRTTSFTAAEVAAGMAELAGAGFKSDAILDATEHILNLARATSTDLAEAALIAGATLNQFGLDASQTQVVVDVLAATANGSATTLTDLGEAMKYAGIQAKASGVSVQQTAAMLAILANNGIKGSMAGTALARAMKNIAEGKADKHFKALGIATKDADGNLRPLPDLMRELGEATKNMGSADRLKIFGEVFGRGSAAALALAESSSAFETLETDITNSTDAAKDAADKMDAGIGGSFRKLFSAVEGMAIGIGEVLAEPLSKIADIIGALAGRITEWIAANQAVVIQVASIVAVVAAAALGLMSLGLAASIAGVAVAGLGSMIAAVGAVLAFVVSPIGLVIAAIVAGIAAFVNFTDAGAQFAEGLGSSFVSAIASVQAFFGQLADSIGLAVELIQAGEMEAAFNVMWSAVQAIFSKGVNSLNKIWQDWKVFFLSVTYDTWGAVQGFFADQWANILTGMNILVFGITEGWAQGIGAMKQAWMSFMEGLTSGISKIASFFGFDSVAESLSGMADAWADDKIAEAEARGFASQRRAADVAATQNEIEQQASESQRQIAKEKEAMIAESEQAAEENIANTQQAEDEAAASSAAVDMEAREKLEQDPGAEAVENAAEAETRADEAAESIAGAGILAAGSEASAEGTFSAAAAGLSMGVGSPSKNIEDILGKILGVNTQIANESAETREAQTIQE